MRKGRPRNLDFEREDAEFWDRNRDLTGKQVGERFDIPETTAIQFCRRVFGETISERKGKVKTKFDPELARRVAEYWDAHDDFAARIVGEQFGITQGQVSKYYQLHFGRPMAAKRAEYNAKRDAAIRAAIEGSSETIRKIAEEFGVSEKLVSVVSGNSRAKRRQELLRQAEDVIKARPFFVWGKLSARREFPSTA